jgi:hypothetical protein
LLRLLGTADQVFDDIWGDTPPEWAKKVDRLAMKLTGKATQFVESESTDHHMCVTESFYKLQQNNIQFGFPTDQTNHAPCKNQRFLLR